MSINDNLSYNHLLYMPLINISVCYQKYNYQYTNYVNLISNSISPLNYLHHALKKSFSNIILKPTTTK